jgi:hypothetical protein
MQASYFYATNNFPPPINEVTTSPVVSNLLADGDTLRLSATRAITAGNNPGFPGEMCITYLNGSPIPVLCCFSHQNSTWYKLPFVSF